jgi:hypothetical protein
VEVYELVARRKRMAVYACVSSLLLGLSALSVGISLRHVATVLFIAWVLIAEWYSAGWRFLTYSIPELYEIGKRDKQYKQYMPPFARLIFRFSWIFALIAGVEFYVYFKNGAP